MIKVDITKQSNYPVANSKLKTGLRSYLEGKGVVSEAQVSVALVGVAKMKNIAKRYLKSDKVHNVLSFTATETKETFAYPDDGVMRLGEIIVCYPQAVKEAKSEDKLIDLKVLQLITHGARHLMGEHHDS